MYTFISDRSTVWIFGFELDVLYEWHFRDFFGKEKNYEVLHSWVLGVLIWRLRWKSDLEERDVRMKLFLWGSNWIESYDNVGIILKLKDIRFEHKTFTDKTQPCNHQQSYSTLDYYKTIAANKVYYKRQVYAARASLNGWDPAKDKTLVALVLGWFISLLQRNA